MQSEKLASSEIAESRPVDESRKRFLEAWRESGYADMSTWREISWDLWQAAERDTRERCAQLAIDAIKEIMRDHFPSRMFTQEIELVCVRVAERIRGKE